MARRPDVLVQMICARVLAGSAHSQSARDRQTCAPGPSDLAVHTTYERCVTDPLYCDVRDAFFCAICDRRLVSASSTGARRLTWERTPDRPVEPEDPDPSRRQTGGACATTTFNPSRPFSPRRRAPAPRVSSPGHANSVAVRAQSRRDVTRPS